MKLRLSVEIWPANRTGQGPSTVPSRSRSAPHERTPSVALRGELSDQGCIQMAAYDSEPPPYS